MPWYFAVAERDHEIQNPTSTDEIRALGAYLRLDARSHVLDVACGKAGPALILAGEFGCRITGVERAAEFASSARERIAEAGLDDRVEIVERDARDFRLDRDAYDVAMCLGAGFIWEGLVGTLRALAPAARPKGHVVVGEPYWRRWPLPNGVGDDGWVPLAETMDRFTTAGLAPEALIASSEDDWDRYESLHWRALEEWLAANPDDPEAPELRERHVRSRADYLRWQRELLGWAIFVARKA